MISIKHYEKKISISLQEFLDIFSLKLYKKQPIKIEMPSHSEHCVIIYLQTLQMDGSILNTNFHIYPEYEPYHSNNRYPYSKYFFPSFVIQWCLHTEPYTENPSEKRK